MKQFKCGDVVPGCQWVARNEDEDELFGEIAVHTPATPTGWTRFPPEVVDAIQARSPKSRLSGSGRVPKPPAGNAPRSRNVSSAARCTARARVPGRRPTRRCSTCPA